MSDEPEVWRTSPEVAAKIVYAMYVGERCKFCNHRYASVDDLDTRDVVYAGYHEGGRLACKECWDKHQKEEKAK